MSIAISGSSITFPDLTTQITAAVGAGFKNRIYNGDMRIWQRGTSFTNPTLANYYTADRWGANRSSDVNGAVVSRISSGLAGFEYALALQRASGNTSAESLSLQYSNESTNTYDLVGSPVTLSFWAKTGSNYSGGPLFVRIRSGTGVDQRVYAYTGLNDFAASTQAITSTWTRYSLTGTVPSSTTQLGFYMFWTPPGTAAGADDSVYITGVQLEQGSTATDFERRPIGTELALCQRYFLIYEFGVDETRCGAHFLNGNTQATSLSFPVTMRSSPTASFNTTTGSFWNLTANAPLNTAVSSFNTTKSSFRIGTTGNPGSINPAMLVLSGSPTLSAEL